MKKRRLNETGPPPQPLRKARGTCRKPAVLTPTLPRAGVASLCTRVPAPAQGQGLGRQHRLTQGLPKVPHGEESRPILDPQWGVFCLLSEHTNSFEIHRRHQRAGLARLPASRVFCPLLLAPPSPASLKRTSFRTAFLLEAVPGVDHSSWKIGQT